MGFLQHHFSSFCLFRHLNWPWLAGQWVWLNFFGLEGGLTIPPHHSIAKYLINLKLMARTGTYILGHCVKKQTNSHHQLSFDFVAVCKHLEIQLKRIKLYQKLFWFTRNSDTRNKIFGLHVVVVLIWIFFLYLQTKFSIEHG